MKVSSLIGFPPFRGLRLIFVSKVLCPSILLLRLRGLLVRKGRGSSVRLLLLLLHKFLPFVLDLPLVKNSRPVSLRSLSPIFPKWENS